MARDTGFPAADAQSDFLRARRERALARLAARLRRLPDDVQMILPFDEVVDALGRRGERALGLQSVRLDTIVGTVDRTREFDRSFRPTTGRVRPRWERIALAYRRGESLPPISLYRVGTLHFVRDGHHRVSVARAQGLETIDAYVTEILTRVAAPDSAVRLSELAFKDHERVFAERVPLPPAGRERVRVSDPWDYAVLAEGVEAWGFRAMQDMGELLDRKQVAALWFDDDYRPVVRMLREAGMIGPGTEADAYMRIVNERYRILRTHEWSEDVLDRLRGGGVR
jgi:hypothetical protein